MFKNKKAEAQSFENYIGAFLLSALFLISLYGFATSTGDRYNKNMTIDSQKIDLTGLQTKVEAAAEDSEKWQAAVREDKPDIYLAVVVLSSIWGVIRLIWSAVIGILNIFLQATYNVIGIPPIVTGVVVTLLIIGLIFAAWRKYKTGN